MCYAYGAEQLGSFSAAALPPCGSIPCIPCMTLHYVLAPKALTCRPSAVQKCMLCALYVAALWSGACATSALPPWLPRPCRTRTLWLQDIACRCLPHIIRNALPGTRIAPCAHCKRPATGGGRASRSSFSSASLAASAASASLRALAAAAPAARSAAAFWSSSSACGERVVGYRLVGQ